MATHHATSVVPAASSFGAARTTSLTPYNHAAFGYSDDPEPSCTRCSEEIDPGMLHEVAGEPVCSTCCDVCVTCGEWIDDDAPESFGPEVIVRDWLTGRKEAQHALCAASRHIGAQIGEEYDFDASEASRETIAAAVASLGKVVAA